MRSMGLTLAAAALLLASRAAQAAPPAGIEALAKAFGARPEVANLQLSPSGRQVLYFTPAGSSRTALIVADVASGRTRAVTTDRDAPVELASCGWKSDERILCDLYGVAGGSEAPITYVRVVAFNVDGSGSKVLGQRSNARQLRVNQYSGDVIDWLPDDPDHVLMAIDMIPEVATGTRIGNQHDGLAAHRVNVRTGAMTRVGGARDGGIELITDNRGQVRVLSTMGQTPAGYLASTVRYHYRPTEGGAWKLLGSADANAPLGLVVEGLDDTGEHLFTLEPHQGRQALFRRPLANPSARELVFAHPVVDVSGVWRIGKYRRPVAAAYHADGLELHFFDRELERLSGQLSAALPGKPQVAIIDESWDGSVKLVFIENDQDPGRYFVYTPATRELVELTGVRPALKDLPLGRVTPVRYPARDCATVPGYLTLPPGRTDARGLPAMLMPHGGPSARDTYGFDFLAQFFAAQGYAVLQPNFRGSSGYGEAWYANNGFKSWRTAISDVNDGARWLATSHGVDPKAIAIFGWSYGGYAALLGNVVDPGLYRAVVAVAPVTDLQRLKGQYRGYSSYALARDFVGSGAHIVEGSPARQAARIDAPVLLFHGDGDLNVNLDHSRMMERALREAGNPAELIVYPGLRHSLGDSTARADMLARSARFLRQALSAPAPAPPQSP